MKFLRSLYCRLPWLNFPAVALIALLQRTPVLRLLLPAESLVTAPPMAHVLRSTFAVGVSLGAVHSLAGATQFNVTTNAVTVTAGQQAPTIAFAVTGALTPAGSYRITSLPPGMTVPGANANGVLNGTSGVISGTPTTAGTYRTTILAYEFNNATGDAFGPATITYTINAPAAVTPVFITQPATQTVSTGATVNFSATASGTPTPTYQWRKDGTAITGATNNSLTLANVQIASAGAYTVVATNSAGSAVSDTATLVVNSVPTSAPVFTLQPVAQVMAAGSTVVFSATATGATSYRWQRNNTDVPGGSTATLVLKDLTSAQAGSYRVVATNTVGSTNSSAVTLTVNTVAATEVGRLINLSVLTTASSGDKVLTVGAVVGPLNFSGTLPLVARAVGPTLGNFGVGGTLADPTLTVRSSTDVVLATNDDWGGGSALVTAFSSVGAFELPASSRDSAVLLNPVPAPFTMQVAGKNGASGQALAEIYDASTARSATSPRLINLSTRAQIDAGSQLTAGFVVRGSTSRTVLVRGVGPTLAGFGVSGAMADPKLVLFNNDTQTQVLANNDWAGDDQLRDAAASVGAFALVDTASKDAVVLVTLPPGAYSAIVSSNVATAGGIALVEVYEVP